MILLEGLERLVRFCRRQVLANSKHVKIRNTSESLNVDPAICRGCHAGNPDPNPK